jgi:hypothetical protein
VGSRLDVEAVVLEHRPLVDFAVRAGARDEPVGEETQPLDLGVDAALVRLGGRERLGVERVEGVRERARVAGQRGRAAVGGRSTSDRLCPGPGYGDA